MLNKWTYILPLIFIVIGFWLGRKTVEPETHTITKTPAKPDTSHQQIEFKDPPPRLIKALLDSALADTLKHLYPEPPGSEPSAPDSTHPYPEPPGSGSSPSDSGHPYPEPPGSEPSAPDSGKTYLPYATLKSPYPLGYFRDGKFIQQGLLDLRYYNRLDFFYIDYTPTPPPLTTITNENIIIQTKYKTIPLYRDPRIYITAATAATLGYLLKAISSAL